MNTSKYTAINIGPIISTFAMARKPRELWAASYLFSHLMKCIYDAALDKGCNVISPEKPQQPKNKIGIYPDRLFINGAPKTIEVLTTAKEKFCETTELKDYQIEQYFNLMSVTCEETKDSIAIGKLNQSLDILELCNYAADHDATKAIRHLITKTNNSPLFFLETDNRDKFPYDINTLAEIATARLRSINPTEWDNAKKNARDLERKAEKKRTETVKQGEEKTKDLDNAEKSIDINEDYFFKSLSNITDFKNKIKSHHKYFCVVQADGDNVGKTVSHKDLQGEQLHAISSALVQFGQKAANTIENFGGLPIYAGGDDLLFIAPVIGKDGKHIFQLLDDIENNAFKGVKEAVDYLKLKDDKDIEIQASLSFGISISYYKYPLYEAFESALNLLFGTAKQISQKKAVAWSFRKHSGGTFDAAFSLKDTNLQTAFQNLIKNTTDDTIVSAVAHKLRQEEALVKTVMAAEKDIKGKTPRPRLDALFDKILEFQDNDYFICVKNLMPLLYNEVGEDKFISTLYSLLRTAKFIKGEDLHDEE